MPLADVPGSTPSSVARSVTAGTAPELPPDAVVAAPADAVVAAPPDAVVPPPADVVAVPLLLALSLPQAARMLGATATAAPAAPRRVSTCRRVTRRWWTGCSGSISGIRLPFCRGRTTGSPRSAD